MPIKDFFSLGSVLVMMSAQTGAGVHVQNSVGHWKSS